MQPHRSNALHYAFAASAAHSRAYGGCAAEAAVSEASGPRVSGCIRAPRYFNPNPVKYTFNGVSINRLSRIYNQRVARIVKGYRELEHSRGRLGCGQSSGLNTERM